MGTIEKMIFGEDLEGVGAYGSMPRTLSEMSEIDWEKYLNELTDDTVGPSEHGLQSAIAMPGAPGAAGHSQVQVPAEQQAVTAPAARQAAPGPSHSEHAGGRDASVDVDMTELVRLDSDGSMDLFGLEPVPLESGDARHVGNSSNVPARQILVESSSAA
jgi:hypothetical protein